MLPRARLHRSTERGRELGAGFIEFCLLLVLVVVIGIAAVGNVGEKTAAGLCEDAAGRFNGDLKSDLVFKDGTCKVKTPCLLPPPLCP